MVITRTCEGVAVLAAFAPTLVTLIVFSSETPGVFGEQVLSAAKVATLVAFLTDLLFGLPARFPAVVFVAVTAAPRLLWEGVFRTALRGLGGLMNMGKNAWRKARMILTLVITSSPAMGDWESPAKRPRSDSISAARLRRREASLLSVSI